MDATEIKTLTERIEALRRKQREHDAIQRILANQIVAVERAMVWDAVAIVAIHWRFPSGSVRRASRPHAIDSASNFASLRPAKSVVLVEDVFGLAEIYGLQSHLHALQLCDRLELLGIKATFAAAIKGYQITVYGLRAHHVLRLLGVLGVEAVTRSRGACAEHVYLLFSNASVFAGAAVDDQQGIVRAKHERVAKTALADVVRQRTRADRAGEIPRGSACQTNHGCSPNS